MEAMILDRDFNNVLSVDNFQSFIWTDKYQSSGDFEIHSPPTELLIEHAKKDYYVWFRDSEHVMIIDTIEIESDLDNGDMMTISGESLESILKRRWIIDEKISIVDEKDIQDFVANLFLHCFGSGDRKVERFFFERNPALEASQFEPGKAYTVSGDYYETNFYDSIAAVCVAKDLGFKVTLEEREIDSAMRLCMILKLYNGVDRSYDQENRPPVTFSPNFENLLSSSYYSSYRSYTNTAIVHYTDSIKDESGESTDVLREQYAWLGGGNDQPKGLDRRETFLIASPDRESDNIEAQMVAEGYSKLKETETTEAFDGEVDPFGQYQYGRDFLVGDMVQIANQYNYYAKSRVTAVTFSSDVSGEKIYPTFEKVSDLWTNQNGS